MSMKRTSNQFDGKLFLLKLHVEFDEEKRLAREKVEKEKEASIDLTEEWDDIQAKIEANHELAQRLQAEEQEELSVEEKEKLFQQLLDQRRKHFFEMNKPLTQDNKENNVAFKEGEYIVDFMNGLGKDTAKLQSLMKVIPDEEEVAIDVVPLAVKSLSIVGWKIHKEGKKSYYQIMRADGKS
ncbi:hypothetical protein Tco_0726356 [Tanacetum coccineum]|uniref:Uncharacterized protein n=1 Tax=Tanacetum coccineum TaxID=301880 RepID=A0ABQ4YG78_9ASTR